MYANAGSIVSQKEQYASLRLKMQSQSQFCGVWYPSASPLE